MLTRLGPAVYTGRFTMIDTAFNDRWVTRLRKGCEGIPEAITILLKGLLIDDIL